MGEAGRAGDDDETDAMDEPDPDFFCDGDGVYIDPVAALKAPTAEIRRLLLERAGITFIHPKTFADLKRLGREGVLDGYREVWIVEDDKDILRILKEEFPVEE